MCTSVNNNLEDSICPNRNDGKDRSVPSPRVLSQLGRVLHVNGVPLRDEVQGSCHPGRSSHRQPAEEDRRHRLQWDAKRL